MDSTIYIVEAILARMGIAKVTSNFQVTIPKDIRKMKEIDIGDEVLFTLVGNKVDFLKVSEEPLESFAGIWRKSNEGAVNEVRRSRRASDRRSTRLGI